MNKILVCGRMTKDPVLREAVYGKMVTFGIAEDREKNKDTDEKKTTFYDVSAFGQCADLCYSYLKKGELVAVKGTLTLDEYSAKDGTTRQTLRIRADRVESITMEEIKQYSASQRNGGTPAPRQQELTEVSQDDLPF